MDPNCEPRALKVDHPVEKLNIAELLTICFCYIVFCIYY